jgi:hypothetical protein
MSVPQKIVPFYPALRKEAYEIFEVRLPDTESRMLTSCYALPPHRTITKERETSELVFQDASFSENFLKSALDGGQFATLY